MPFETVDPTPDLVYMPQGKSESVLVHSKTSTVEGFFTRALLESLKAIEAHGTGGDNATISREKLLEQLEALQQRSGRHYLFFSHHGSRIHRAVAEAVEDERQEKESHEKEVERLGKEVERLTVQNELLQTRVAEMRRSLSREARNSDKLHMELVSTREANIRLLEMQDRYLTLLSDRARANDALVAKMAAVEDGLVRMHESYEGQVQHVGENTAVVVYTVDGQIVEQTYEKKQFKDGKLPLPGTCVKVLIFLVEYEPEPPSDKDLERATSDKPSHRKPLNGPVDF